MYPILAGAGKKKKAESAPHVSIGCMITLAAALDVDYSFGNHDVLVTLTCPSLSSFSRFYPLEGTARDDRWG